MSTIGNGGGGNSVKPKTPRIPQLGPSPAGPGLAPAPPIGGPPGGGGGPRPTGSNSTGQIGSTAPIPSAAAFLGGDSTYQQQQSQYQKALSDFMAQQNTQRTQYDSQFKLDNNSLGDSRQQAEGGLTDDYAGRGLLNSGVYGKAYSDLESDYDTRQTQLQTARQTFLQQLNDALTNLKGDQQTGLTQAKQDALARRAASIGA